jgi:hypothetical protein
MVHHTEQNTQPQEVTISNHAITTNTTNSSEQISQTLPVPVQSSFLSIVGSTWEALPTDYVEVELSPFLIPRIAVVLDVDLYKF